MERRDRAMLGGFAGTILAILVVLFTELHAMDSRFEDVDRHFEAVD